MTNMIKELICATLFIVIVSIFISCTPGDSYSLQVIHPQRGKIYINDKPLQNWVIRKHGNKSDESIMYFLNLSHQRYKLKIELENGSVIDTFFILATGESYYSIDLKTGELYGFE